MKIRIDWSEIDLFGHVNNLAILKYIQAARVKYLESIGLMKMQSNVKLGPILASVSCQFSKPLFYPGEVFVHSHVDRIKNTSFVLKHIVYNDGQEVAAEAQDIIVFFDFVNNIKLKIPDKIREKIEAFKNEMDTHS